MPFQQCILAAIVICRAICKSKTLALRAPPATTSSTAPHRRAPAPRNGGGYTTTMHMRRTPLTAAVNVNGMMSKSVICLILCSAKLPTVSDSANRHFNARRQTKPDSNTYWCTRSSICRPTTKRCQRPPRTACQLEEALQTEQERRMR